MGLLRGLWRGTGLGWAVDTIKNVRNEGDVVDGLKRTLKEDFCEDNPITSVLYRSGKDDGKTEGYIDASKEYRKKFLKQADDFEKKTNLTKREFAEYEKLLDEYEQEIALMSAKNERTETEIEYLKQLQLRESKLKKMVI